MIVDALTHLNPDPKAYGPAYDLSVEFLVKQLEGSPVDKAIVTAIEADSPYATTTEYVAECRDRFPDRIIGFCSVDPLHDPEAVKKLEHYVRDLAMKGLKLHPRHQGLRVDNPKVTEVVEKATELNIPVTICGSQWKHAPLEDQLPIHIDTLCKRVPEAHIIIAHAGGFRFMDAFMVAVANDNVSLETSIALRYFEGTPFEDQLIFAFKQLGPKRLIYGSDHPEDPIGESYRRSRAMLERHGFSAEDCALIFGQNILSLLPD